MMKNEFKGHANKGGVYKITNTINDKVYIGSAKTFKTRVVEHASRLKNNNHVNKHLQASFNKHGSDAFLFEVVEVVSGKKLCKAIREQHFIDLELATDWKQCFNIVKKTIRAKGPWSHTPEESRKNMSEAHKGKVHSEESRKKMSESAKKRWQDPEYRKERSDSMKKKWQNPEYRKNMFETRKGKVHTKEAKRKMSEAAKKRHARARALKENESL